MSWEQDAEVRESHRAADPIGTSPVMLSYLLLKPDGNRSEVTMHIDRVFRMNHIPEFGRITTQFTFNEAFDFYPKDEVWCKKYGQKRIDALQSAGHMTDEVVAKTPLEMGCEILHKMAEYLSSGPCMVILFEAAEASRYGRELAGATVPAEAHPQSLRGMFSQDSIKASSLERRALNNVVHAPDEENVGEELAFIFGLASMTSFDKDRLASRARPAFPHKAHLFS